ncbi:Uncharacterized protein Fot_39331 [Forsythia ovata]|uniref:Uncharacterized protein n=1 Tax=Forsythia ovata TaxID=205694 RepID=A0ABD1S4A4_9LAMI
MPKTFNIPQIRKYLATELYVYAKKKQVENYDTDNDWFHVNEINNVVFEGFFAKDVSTKYFCVQMPAETPPRAMTILASFTFTHADALVAPRYRSSSPISFTPQSHTV